MALPDGVFVNDFTLSNHNDMPDGSYSIGRYDEVRPTMYNQLIFSNTENSVDGFSGVRDVHVGLDISGPIGTPVLSWTKGVVLHSGYNPSDGDYGNVIVTAHTIGEVPVYSLYGHLDARTLKLSPVGRHFEAGEELGALGGRLENGGWSPHVHFQLSLVEPTTHDLPGVVSRADREKALETYPDPRLVLGMLYP
jgi:murein DD-endopeptidase MepM/ murein hydrolase activator NlpD